MLDDAGAVSLAAGTSRLPDSMPTYVVLLHLEFVTRPSRDEQAFLGSLNAQVQPWGSTDLQVSLDVTAPDIATALAQAKELVADPLGGEPQSARLALKGLRVQRSSLWRRWRSGTS
jgi:hypothetical protein